MSIDNFTRANGFLIENNYGTGYSDAYNDDYIKINYDAASGEVTFVYTKNGSDYRGSWYDATGAYSSEHDCIGGKIRVRPADGGVGIYEGTFLITRDRDLAHHARRIHVYVQVPGGAPDEGSYTGDGR